MILTSLMEFFCFVLMWLRQLPEFDQTKHGSCFGTIFLPFKWSSLGRGRP